MRLRNLLAATAVGALALGGVGVPAYSTTAAPPADAGGVVVWGDPDDLNAGSAAINVPTDLLSDPAIAVATNQKATGVVTQDGRIRVWGRESDEVLGAPSDVTDATAIALTANHGAALREDGRIVAWGSGADDAGLNGVPSDLRAKAFAVQNDTGFAVRPDGTLTTWGAAPLVAAPAGLTDLVDVAAGLGSTVVLRADGTIVNWGLDLPGLNDHPDFGSKKVTKIVAGFLSYAVIFEDGTIKNWGPQAPTGEPTFDGLTPAGKVVSLSLAPLDGVAAAVTADGKVHTWGATTPAAVSAVPASLTGRPVSTVALGPAHAAVIVTRVASTTTLAVSPATAAAGSTRTATATVTTGGSTAGGTVTFKVGTTTRIASVIGGKATWALPFQAAGSRVVTATYNGTSSTFASTATPATIKVTKAASTVKAKAKANRKAEKVTFTITVTTAKGVAPTGKVTIKLKGKTKKTVSVRVNAQGKAAVTVKKLKAGKYTAQLKYAGNANSSGSNGSVKFKI